MKLAVPSIAAVLWEKLPLSESAEDVLKTLQAVNLEMNGPMPSENAVRESLVRRDVVYSMSEIIRMIHHSSRSVANVVSKDDMITIAWRLEVAWAAILAGDIDNILEHVAEEEATRDN